MSSDSTIMKKKKHQAISNGKLSISWKLKWTSVLPFGFPMSFGGHQSIFKICVQPHSPHSVNSQGRSSTRWANTGASLFTPGIGQVEIYISLLQVHGAVPQGQVLFGQSIALRKVRLIDASCISAQFFHCVWLTALLFVQIYPKKSTHLYV